MMDLAELIAFRDSLARARYAGIRSVDAPGGRRVSYQSDAEMERALASLDREIVKAEGRSPVSQVRISATKGV